MLSPSPAVKKILLDPFMEELFLKKDLAYFAERVLDMEIVGHHKKWSRQAATKKRICIISARDHGKSFMWCFAYAIWRGYHNWLPEIPPGFKSIPRTSLGYIWSNTQEQAIKHLTLIKEEVLTNPKLAHLIPTGKGPSGPLGWSQKQIVFRNGAVIRAMGWGGAVRGAHPVWGVCDDVLNDETIYSELVRRKQIDYFFSAVTPMIIPFGQLIVVGTPFHAADLYASLEKNKEYSFSRFPAQGEGYDALWPTRYPKETLEAKAREIGSVRFSREYLCQPISEESSLFPESILSPCYDENFEMPKHLTQADLRELQVFTGVDLALSATVGADFTVIMTVGVDKQGNIWILNMRRFKGKGMTEQLREIQMVYNSFKPMKILIEDNQFQRVFKDELVRNTMLPVEGFTTTGRNKNDFERGIPSMQILFENRKYVIPRNTEFDRETTDVMLNELKSFSWMDGKLQGVGEHDDTVMALWIATEAARSSTFSAVFV